VKVGQSTPRVLRPTRPRITLWSKAIAAAVIAVGLIGSPVLAQGATNASNSTSQPTVKADAKVDVIADVKTKKTLYEAGKVMKRVQKKLCMARR
jgi:hypothetical protein